MCSKSKGFELNPNQNNDHQHHRAVQMTQTKKGKIHLIIGWYVGVYVTRNKDTYHHGRMLLNHNKAYRNGINGLVVHKTDRAQVVGNVIWDNGKVRWYHYYLYFVM